MTTSEFQIGDHVIWKPWGSGQPVKTVTDIQGIAVTATWYEPDIFPGVPCIATYNAADLMLVGRQEA